MGGSGTYVADGSKQVFLDDTEHAAIGAAVIQAMRANLSERG